MDYKDRDFKDRDNRERKEEVYSQAIPAGKRRYFFDVKETRGGERYITITESRKIFNDRSGDFTFEKNKLFLYKEDFEKFHKGLENALSFIETGIVPPPVVDEHDNNSTGSRTYDLDDIDFNY
ncbi:MAG: DUF3276 family protein [Bacteroidales bacterium]|nr:DUF3276 family protein [Bacteroidales bacterium]